MWTWKALWIGAAAAGDPSVCQVPAAGSDLDAVEDYGWCLLIASAAAYDVFSRVWALDASRLDVFTAMARIAVQDDRPEAAALWEGVRDRVFTGTEELGARALLAAHLGQWDHARADLDEVLRRSPEPYWHLVRARVAACAGDRLTARSDALEALRLRSHGRLQACWLLVDLDRVEGRTVGAGPILRRPECRVDREPAEGSVHDLWTGLEAQLAQTFGPGWNICSL